jgi:anti-sigma factor RsiW
MLMRDDHPTAEALAAYLEAEVSQEERRRVERHLLHCAICYEEVLTLVRILECGATNSGADRPS